MQNWNDVESFELNVIGPRLEKNISVTELANIECECVWENKTIRMRVWERGVWVTLACGSGACATLVAASMLNKSTEENKVILDGGDLCIKWLSNGKVTLSGDTEKVYEGIIGN